MPNRYYKGVGAGSPGVIDTKAGAAVHKSEEELR